MAAQLLLVNPRRKRRAKRARAVNPRRSRRTRARRSSARRRRTSVIVARRINPRRKHHARRVHRARRRHNPRMLGGFSIRGITSALVPAAIGGAGAVALDVGLSYLPASVPDFLKTGIGNKGLKIAGAIALGMIAGKVLGRETGKAVGAGALTVVAYGIVRDLVKQVAPTLPLSGTDYQDFAYNPAPMLTGMGAYMDNGVNQFQAAQMGAYMHNDGM